MWNLALSEMLRFRRLWWTVAISHALLLLAMAVLGSLCVPAAWDGNSGYLGISPPLYLLGGLLFGALQLRPYRQPGLWLFLLHRPLPRSRIFAALVTSAVLPMLLTVLLPIWLVTLAVDHLTLQWVDWRDYGAALLILGAALLGYFAAVYITLSARRTALAVLVLPAIWLIAVMQSWWILAALGVMLAWLGYLAFAAMRPDLSAPERGPLTTWLGALPLQYILFWVLMFCGLLAYSTRVAFIDRGWDLHGFAAHRWDDYFADDTFARVAYLFGAEAFGHGVSLEPAAEARQRFDSVDLQRVVEIAPWWSNLPTRGQIRGQPPSMDRQQVLRDRAHGRKFLFRHDLLRFQGWGNYTMKTAGWLGVSGWKSDSEAARGLPEPFVDVPFVVDDEQAVGRQQIYFFDAQRSTFDLRFTAADDEVLMSPWIDHDGFATVLTDRRLYVLTTADNALIGTASGPAQQVLAVPMPGELNNLLKVLVGPMDGGSTGDDSTDRPSSDGFAVSFVCGTMSARDLAPGRQLVGQVDTAGRWRVIIDQPLVHGPPAWSRHWGFITSPLIQTLHDITWSTLGPGHDRTVTAKDLLRHPPPASVLGMALAVALLSAVLGGWLAHQRRRPNHEIWRWALFAASCGLPGFLSLLAWIPRPEGGDPR